MHKPDSPSPPSFYMLIRIDRPAVVPSLGENGERKKKINVTECELEVLTSEVDGRNKILFASGISTKTPKLA